MEERWDCRTTGDFGLVVDNEASDVGNELLRVKESILAIPDPWRSGLLMAVSGAKRSLTSCCTQHMIVPLQP